MLVLAVIAAVVSYSHMFELAQRHGEPPWRAALFPLSVDGMIVASSMALLADARHGRRGGLLPWTQLVLGSVASLAANIAVADPTLWSRVIHAWPSFALLGAYELLMREFRIDAHGARTAIAPDEQSVRTAQVEAAMTESPEQPGSEGKPGTGGGTRPRLHVVEARTQGTAGITAEGADPSEVVPQVQLEAWSWALDNRREDGSLRSQGALGAVDQAVGETGALRWRGGVSALCGARRRGGDG
ncbi:DUF2637 domain-containing protein [Murinocardiopsis flavida]|uniref:DUF2637 domain-containing protein n=1 Tax=Murinocardiopsis flavida TaxID=645275 RepID=UPI001FEA9AED|nr:DUF2637 domain-containing protein [Murinocardiopsis flavida]